MATGRQLYEYINQKAPFEAQLPFDNAGFLVGREEAEVARVLISLDITQEVASEAAAIGAQMIVSHHPVIFAPVKAVTDRDTTGRILLTLAERGIAAICAHTNLDAARGGVNDTLAERLGLLDAQCFTDSGIGRIGLLPDGPVALADFITRVKISLGTAGLRAADAGRAIRRVAVVGGAGGEDLHAAAAAGCDVFLTADVKHHVFLEAQALGVSLIDAGHYATEQVICPVLAAWLREGFPTLDVVQTKVHREVPVWV